MSMRAPRRFRPLLLEERALPSTTPYGPLERPYTFTEVMAFIRAADPISELARADAELISAIDSRVIFTDALAGASLVEVRLQPGADPLTAVDELQGQPGVAWAEPNFVYVGDPRDYTPNDPQYGSQYHLTKMQADMAWDTETGDPSIVVAIADDGVAINHPDLLANIWVNAGEIAANGKDDDGNGFVDDLNGWDIVSVDNNPNPLSTDTHGTHVAGIVAADSDNGVGVAGVAGGGPNGAGVRLMPVRWYGSGSWTASVIAQTFTYAADNGAKVVNSSYNFDGWVTGGVPNATVEAGFNYGYGKGVLFMNSAGNNNQLDAPRGVYTQPLFVASTDSGDVKSSFSNYGAFVDIAAPGSSVLATVTDAGGTIHDYDFLSGTSMSTPDAAGVAALIWSKNPSWTREQVVAQLLATADNINAANPTYVNLLGTGRANAFRGVTETLAAPKFAALVGLPAEGGAIATMPASFYVDAPMRFDPATVVVGNFSLIGDGADDAFGTGDDTTFTLTLNGNAPYRVGTGRLNFAVTGSAPADRYRFEAAAGGLTDPFGTPLDGNGDGTGGDDFIRTFFVSRQVDGTIYEDRDTDGGRDSTEPGLSNRTVYVDFDLDGVYDNPAEPSAVTDATGFYVLTGLSPGTYTVRVAAATGWNGAAEPAGGGHVVVISSPTDSNPGRNFGQLRRDAVYGRVYDDANYSNAFEAGEAPLAGWVAFDDLNDSGTIDSATQTVNSTNVPLALPDLKTTKSTLSVAGLAGAITDVNVKLSISHTNDTHLDVYLVGPTGTKVMLFTDVGGSGDNFTNTVLDDQAASAITAGVAPFTGSFRPEGKLSDFNGQAGNGTWTLEVTDDTTGVIGTLTAWSVTITAAETSAVSDADGAYSLIGLAAGSHTIRRVLQAGYTATQPAAGSYAVTLAAGDTVTGRDFGQTKAAPPVPPQVAGITVNDGTPSRSLVTSVRVSFSAPVSFPSGVAAAFALERVGPGGPVGTVNLNAIQAGNDVTLSFVAGGTVGTDPGASLIDGSYKLTVIAANVLGAGGNLDGDGNGTGGDDFVTPTSGTGRIARLFGDSDGDGDTDVQDYGAFRGAFGSSNPIFDFDVDGDVDAADYGAFRGRFGTTV